MKNIGSNKLWNYQWQIFSQKIHLKTNEGVIKEILKITNGNFKGKKILEVGAGSGSDVIDLTKRGAQCFALDFSKESINICQRLAKQEGVNIKTILADCRRIPIESDYFDFVFSVGLVEHFKDPVPILQEQLRVLKKGGFLIVDVPQKYNLYTIVKHLRMKFGKHPFGWETQYSVWDLKKFSGNLGIKQIGFYGRESAFFNHFPKVIDNYWRKLFTEIEKSWLAPFVCLNIGTIYQKN